MKHGPKGFTLVEILLSMGIFSVMIGAIAGFSHLMIVSETRQRVMSDVEQEGVFVMNIITQAIRNASAIVSPSAGVSESSIALDVYDGALDPTVFDVSNGMIRIAQGADMPVPLTSSSVMCPHIEFYNISRPGTPGSVRIEVTLDHANPEGTNEYEYAKTFYATASLR